MSEAELVARLERLERQNRRFRVAGAAALCAVTAVLLAAAVPSIPHNIKAHEFEVLDQSGKPRIRLQSVSANEGEPEIVLLDGSGKARAALDVLAGVPKLDLYGVDNGLPLASIDVQRGGQPHITLLSAHSKSQDILGSIVGASGLVGTQGIDGISITVNGREPAIKLSDSAGFETDVGSASLVTPATGETHKTSAASIVMFGNDKKHHAIWQAPN